MKKYILLMFIVFVTHVINAGMKTDNRFVPRITNDNLYVADDYETMKKAVTLHRQDDAGKIESFGMILDYSLQVIPVGVKVAMLEIVKGDEEYVIIYNSRDDSTYFTLMKGFLERTDLATEFEQIKDGKRM